VTQETNDVGVAQVRFFLKGRPFYITIDYEGVFERETYADRFSYITEHLEEASSAYYDFAADGFWSYLLSKAWRKVKGN